MCNPDMKDRQKMQAIDQTATIVSGDCIELMKKLPSGGVDFILTDPPYIVKYKDRSNRSVRNDDNAEWLKPSVKEMYRVLKQDAFCVSFYGWNKADLFLAAWREAGFRPVGHIVFRKPYASSTRFLQYRHESAYLLAKGKPAMPSNAPADVIDWVYSGNRYHPTQKPTEILKPLIEAFSPVGGIVLDPFCGSGSTLLAAQEMQRNSLGFELSASYCEKARMRLSVN
jgi:site-specific DNA-methyltransferase (adenine-specific)